MLSPTFRLGHAKHPRVPAAPKRQTPGPQGRNPDHSSCFLEFTCSSRYTEAMTTKEKVLQAVQTLPDDASIEDTMERLFLLTRIERGIQQTDAGELIPHEKVKERMAKWLK